MEEQYVLGRKCGWSIKDTNKMPDFERKIYINLVMKEIEKEKEAMSGGKNK